MNAETQTRKSRRVSLLYTLLLGSSAAVYAVAAAAPQTAIAVALGLVASTSTGSALRRTSRALVYTTLIALGLTTLETQLFTVSPDRFFLMPAGVYGPAVLYLGVALTFLEQRQVTRVAILTLAFLGLLLAGNVFDLPEEPAPFPGYALLARSFRTFYAGALTMQVLAGLLLLRHGWVQPGPARRHERAIERLALAIALLLALLLTAGLSRWTAAAEPFLTRLYSRYVLLQREPRQVVFGPEVNLWRTVPGRRDGDRAIIIRAFARTAPGYLRGRVYDSYADGRWSAQRAMTGLPGQHAPGMRTTTVFTRDLPAADTGRSEPIDLLLTEGTVTEALFAPGPVGRIEIVADSVAEDRAGQLMVDGWELRAGYRVWTGDWGTAAYPLPAALEPEDSPWREVPQALRPRLESFLAEHPLPPAAGADSAAAIRYIERLLSEHCSYSLDEPPADRASDPVLEFLLVRRAGHCELFATAAVLLLRLSGIPARYVTGLVCEEALARDVWVARLEHAHAWAEAFDRQLGRWVLVEATPPAGRPPTAPRTRFGLGWLSQLSAGLELVLARLRRGEVADALVQLALFVGRILAGVIRTPLGWVAMAAIVAWVGLRRRARPRSTPRARPSPMEARLASIRRQLERCLAAQGIVRNSGETWHELARRAVWPHDARPCDAIGLLDAYCRLRYDAEARSKPALARLERKLERWRATGSPAARRHAEPR